jgi:hypothetical protein
MPRPARSPSSTRQRPSTMILSKTTTPGFISAGEFVAGAFAASTSISGRFPGVAPASSWASRRFPDRGGGGGRDDG